MKASLIVNATLADGEHPKKAENNSRQISATELAALQRAMRGAKMRMAGLKDKHQEISDTISRGFALYKNAAGKMTHIDLSSAEIDGLRLRRLRIAEKLEIAKGDYLLAKKAYLDAVSINKIISRKRVHTIRIKNRALRESDSIVVKTMSIFDDLIKEGKEAVVSKLQSLASTGNSKQFRLAFENVIDGIDHTHYEKITRSSKAQTIIINAVKQQLAKSDQTQSVDHPAVASHRSKKGGVQ